MKWLAAACCAYEVASITAGRTPTFTALSRNRPWLRVALIAALGVHLYRAEGSR